MTPTVHHSNYPKYHIRGTLPPRDGGYTDDDYLYVLPKEHCDRHLGFVTMRTRGNTSADENDLKGEIVATGCHTSRSSFVIYHVQEEKKYEVKVVTDENDMPLQCKWTMRVEGIWEKPRAVSVAHSVKERVDNVLHMGSKPRKEETRAQGEKKREKKAAITKKMDLGFYWQLGVRPGSWRLGTLEPDESLRKSPVCAYDAPSPGRNHYLLRNRIVFERDQALDISRVAFLAWVMMMQKNKDEWRRPAQEKGYYRIREIASKDKASSL